MTMTRNKGARETFGTFKSNGVGDPYQDRNKYHLREKTAKTSPKPFTTCSNKLIRRSEYVHMPNGVPERPTIGSYVPRFSTRVKTEAFTSLNDLRYEHDPYERK